MHLSYRRILLLVGLTLTSACMSGDVIDPSDRPDPPPAGSLDADLTFFEGKTPAPGGATTSWGQALQTVNMARTDMELLAVPEALLRAAVAGQPVRSGDSWRWPFSTEIDGEPYDGELRSTSLSSQYEWNLIVSAPEHSPQLSDYLWAQGRTVPSGFEGLWSIADAAAGTDTVVARVSWILNAENTVNFGYSVSDSAVWTYERSTGGDILTYYNYTVPLRRVTWFPDGTGRTWTSATSNACWDEDLHDVVC